jgi:ABC-type glycerol-3-phosphate transport system substrate-binding protein
MRSDVMKFRALTLGIALSAISSGFAGSAAAGEQQPAEALTIAHSWRIAHEKLLREFSQGLGVDLGQSPAIARQ